MAAAKTDLYIEQGASFYRLLSFADGAGAPLDLTGWAFEGQIRETYSAPDILASFVFTLFPQTGATLGQVAMTMAAATTAALPVLRASNYQPKLNNLAYDVQATKPDATIDRILQGTATISPEVTR